MNLNDFDNLNPIEMDIFVSMWAIEQKKIRDARKKLKGNK
jgi:hypothetical protein